MTKFKPGDGVRRTSHNNNDYPFNGMPVGAEDEVTDVRVAGLTLRNWGSGHDPSRFELVPPDPKPDTEANRETKKPEWSDVMPGDTVVFRDIPTGAEYTAMATARGVDRSALVLGTYAGSVLTATTRELLSIQKPQPQPPTTPGSVILIHSASRAWPHGLPLLRQYTGRWVGQNGQSWSDAEVAYANGGTFEVLHDAGNTGKGVN